METIRRHPDVFTGQEAIAYLHLDIVSENPERTLETLRGQYGLIGQKIGGREFLYHRNSLDALVDRAFGKPAQDQVRTEAASLPVPRKDRQPEGAREPRLKMGGR